MSKDAQNRTLESCSPRYLSNTIGKRHAQLSAMTVGCCRLPTIAFIRVPCRGVFALKRCRVRNPTVVMTGGLCASEMGGRAWLYPGWNPGNGRVMDLEQRLRPGRYVPRAFEPMTVPQY